jgi:DNA-binding transcriptional regulator YiaG
MTDALTETRTFRSDAAQDGIDAFATGALIHRIRWHTGLSREEFARALCIGMEQLKALERGWSQPDVAMVDYLRTIARAPEVVGKALHAI